MRFHYFSVTIRSGGGWNENRYSKRNKNNENRVGLSPSGIHALVEQGHTVLVETNAGSGSYFEDEDYKQAGAEIVNDAKQLGM